MSMSDTALIYRALTQWANYIETGDITISAADAHNMGRHSVPKSTTDEQKAFVLRLHQLALANL
jgi:hypothetical protein